MHRHATVLCPRVPQRLPSTPTSNEPYLQERGASIGRTRDEPEAVGRTVKRAQFQSVALADGQLLIGRLRAKASEDFVELHDTHYLQGADAGTKSGPRVASIESQVLNPQPDVVIRRDQIVAIQNIREGSPTKLAIEKLAETKE